MQADVRACNRLQNVRLGRLDARNSSYAAKVQNPPIVFLTSLAAVRGEAGGARGVPMERMLGLILGAVGWCW